MRERYAKGLQETADTHLTINFIALFACSCRWWDSKPDSLSCAVGVPSFSGFSFDSATRTRNVPKFVDKMPDSGDS